MKKSIKFMKLLAKECKKNELMLMSNALTYKLLIAIFPFIIFLMTILGFLNIDIKDYLYNIVKSLPVPVADVLNIFLQEVVDTKRISLLSTSFIISIYSASSGFSSIIQGLNRAYDIEDNRPFLTKKFTSLALVFIFAVLINASLLIFIFREYLTYLIVRYTALEFIPYFLDSLFLYIVIGIILLSMILIIYKIAISKKVPIKHMLPGACITVVSWFFLSKIFNIYINNFSRYSRIYGSIGGIFVLVIWLNMISLVLLIGGQINAILEKRSFFQKNDIYIEK